MKKGSAAVDRDLSGGAAAPTGGIDTGAAVSANTGRSIRWVRQNAFVVLMCAALIAAAIGKPNLFVSGLILGIALALGALGLTVTYGIMKFPNLAHGVVMVLAGYMTFFFYTGQVQRSANGFGDVVFPMTFGALPRATEPFWGLSFGYGLILALIVSAVASVGLSLLIDLLVYRRLRRQRQTSVLMLTIISFGVTYVLIGLIDTVWGLRPRNITSNIVVAHLYPFGITLGNDQVLVFAFAAALTAAATYFLYGTRLGRVMRAMSDNRDLARVSGIDVEQITRYHWVLVGLLVGVSGSLLALVSPLNPQLGLSLLLPLFAAAAVGGIGNPIGALLGGLIVGVAQEVSVAFVAPGYKVAIAFLILVLVLLFRPSGLLGSNQ